MRIEQFNHAALIIWRQDATEFHNLAENTDVTIMTENPYYSYRTIYDSPEEQEMFIVGVLEEGGEIVSGELVLHAQCCICDRWKLKSDMICNPPGIYECENCEEE